MFFLKQKLICSVFLFLLFPLLSFSQVDFTSSNLPIVIIETNGKDIVDEPRIVADMKIIDNGTDLNFVNDSLFNFNGKISIEIRGSSSQLYDKKQYGLTTIKSNGSNQNVSLLGMPEENDWVLAAPYSDKTLIRNVLAFTLSRKIGNYAPRTRFCELVLNGEYMGVYVLTEKIKIDINRVNIAKLKTDEVCGDDLTGGYLLKIDKLTGSKSHHWLTDYANVDIQIQTPKLKELSDPQINYISSYINTYEKLLFSPEFSDGMYRYDDFINTQAAFDFFIISEIAKNVDAYQFSTYIYKDKESKGGKLCFGPVWDFNFAFANAYYAGASEIEDFMAHRHEWWSRMLEDPVFFDGLAERWELLRKGELSNDAVFAVIDSLTTLLKKPIDRNFQRWAIQGQVVWPNSYIGKDYDDDLSFMKSWIRMRLDWMDRELLKTPSTKPNFGNGDIDYYPKPFTDYFTFSFSLDDDEKICINLIDLGGRKLVNIVPWTLYLKGDSNITIYWEYDNIVGNQVCFLEFKTESKTKYIKIFKQPAK